MSALLTFLRSSLGKKFVMAATGCVLVLFVLGHMLGNLQVFLDPDYINSYAHGLHALGPLLWLVRLFLLFCLVAHVWAAVVLTVENRRGRGASYQEHDHVKPEISARTMPVTGLILLAFIIFHILHFTVKAVYDYDGLTTTIPGVEGEVADVHAMMISGFTHWYVSAFYILAMWLLCLHLSHGVSSMFQSVGLRNERWRKLLDDIARWYGVALFLGFVSIPVSVLAGVLESTNPALSPEEPETQVVEVLPAPPTLSSGRR